MLAEHADQVLAIYQLGIDEGDATFETTTPTWQDFDTSHLADHRFVALDAPACGHAVVVGRVAAVPVSER
jgi:L-amino acid N-acyltransferase YncA